MTKEEIIIYTPSNCNAVAQALQDAMDYALLSFPFTANRMALQSVQSRISNIFKGKIAENFLQLFALERGMDLDFTAGQTPFWMQDAFDFSWKGREWDLKNNFLFHKGALLDKVQYLQLPALVPNRHNKDQWAKAGEYNKTFLFTFIRQAEKRGEKPFFDIIYSNRNSKFLNTLAQKYAGQFPDRSPYHEKDFWDELNAYGGKPTLQYHAIPSLVITGVCAAKERRLFLDTDGISHHGYARYHKSWYKVNEGGGLSFLDGMLQTRITNATCPIGFLPSFIGMI